MNVTRLESIGTTLVTLNVDEDRVTLCESWDEARGTDNERLGRRYEVVRPWAADAEPQVVHLTDDYLFPLVRRRPGLYGCRHSDVTLTVLDPDPTLDALHEEALEMDAYRTAHAEAAADAARTTDALLASCVEDAHDEALAEERERNDRERAGVTLLPLSPVAEPSIGRRLGEHLDRYNERARRWAAEASLAALDMAHGEALIEDAQRTVERLAPTLKCETCNGMLAAALLTNFTPENLAHALQHAYAREAALRDVVEGISATLTTMNRGYRASQVWGLLDEWNARAKHVLAHERDAAQRTTINLTRSGVTYPVR